MHISTLKKDFELNRFEKSRVCEMCLLKPNNKGLDDVMLRVVRIGNQIVHFDFKLLIFPLSQLFVLCLQGLFVSI